LEEEHYTEVFHKEIWVKRMNNEMSIEGLVLLSPVIRLLILCTKLLCLLRKTSNLATLCIKLRSKCNFRWRVSAF